MKKELSPGIAITIIAVVVVIVVGVIWWVYNKPSAPAPNSSAAGLPSGGARARVQAMKEAMQAAHQQQKPPNGSEPPNRGGTH